MTEPLVLTGDAGAVRRDVRVQDNADEPTPEILYSMGVIARMVGREITGHSAFS